MTKRFYKGLGVLINSDALIIVYMRVIINIIIINARYNVFARSTNYRVFVFTERIGIVTLFSNTRHSVRLIIMYIHLYNN